jgi:hypothetical protein
MFDSDPISCYLLLRPFCGLFYPVLEANVSWQALQVQVIPPLIAVASR